MTPRRILLLAALLFSCATLARGQTGLPYQITPPVPNASFTVCSFPASGNPCSNAASIFADAAESSPITQPVQLGSSGTMIFYVSAGSYTIQFSGTSSQSINFGVGGGGGSGAITNQVLNQLPLGGAATSVVSGTVANGLSGQVLQSTNAAAPTFVSPGLPWGNGSAAVTTTPYAVACDSGTAVVDRGTTILFQSGASVINLPDPTAAGCTGNFAVSLYDDGAGTLTVNRGGTSTINVLDGTTNTDGATSFTLATGQAALCNANAAGTIWACRKLTGGSGVVEIPNSQTSLATTSTGLQQITIVTPTVNTMYRVGVYLADNVQGSGCSTAPVLKTQVTWTDAITNSSTNSQGSNLTITNGTNQVQQNTVFAFVKANTALQAGINVSTAAVGCTTAPTISTTMEALP